MEYVQDAFSVISIHGHTFKFQYHAFYSKLHLNVRNEMIRLRFYLPCLRMVFLQQISLKVDLKALLIRRQRFGNTRTRGKTHEKRFNSTLRVAGKGKTPVCIFQFWSLNPLRKLDSINICQYSEMSDKILHGTMLVFAFLKGWKDCTEKQIQAHLVESPNHSTKVNVSDQPGLEYLSISRDLRIAWVHENF